MVLGMWENLPSFAFYALERSRDHKHYKSRVSIGHAFRPHPFMPRAQQQLHMRELNAGKGHHVHKHNYYGPRHLLHPQ